MGKRIQDKRRRIWSGYECPACYAVFRVPKGNEHRPVYCPGCDAILRLTSQPVRSVLPSPDEGPTTRTAPVMEELETVHEEVAGVTESGMVRKKRRRRKVSTGREVDWDRKDKSRHRRQDPFLVLVFTLSVVTFAGVLYLIGWVADNSESEEQAPSGGGSALGLLLDDDPVEVPVEDATPEAGAGSAPIDPVEHEEGIATAVRSFLEAPDVDSLLGTIRNRAANEDKVREYYRKKAYEPVAVHSIAEDGVLSSLGTLVSVNVTLSNFGMKPMALEWEGDRFLVDWDSWVGYSELTLDEFMTRQPLRSRLFRVLAQPVDYYNFAFSNDRKWRCFELRVAGEEKSLYGYVGAGSGLEKLLTPLDPDAKMPAFVVCLRYPESPQTRNQVLIEKVVASGWVVREEEP